MMKSGKLTCPRCNYKMKGKADLEIKEEMRSGHAVAVVDEKEGDEMYPKTEFDCPKCGNKEAFFWQRQMRSGDEPESKFFKCTKCKHTVRED